MNRRRHWREQWDPTAPLQWRKRLNLGATEAHPDGLVHPGDPVTDEQRQRIGLKRLRLWWDGEFIELNTSVAGEPLLRCEDGMPAVSSMDVKRALNRRRLRHRLPEVAAAAAAPVKKKTRKPKLAATPAPE